MDDSVLIRAFGDSVNLRMLSFFLENPFDKYSINQISDFSEISRNSVYKYLPTFLEKGYLIQEKKGKREFYKLNQSNSVIQMLDQFIDEVGDLELKPQIEESKKDRNENAEFWMENRESILFAHYTGSA
jgi:sugar-specific transcriptional regulator TrmB